MQSGGYSFTELVAGGYSSKELVADCAPNAAPSWCQLYLADLTSWFVGKEGFGKYLRQFFKEYEVYFNEYQEEHAHQYHEIHAVFAARFEADIGKWLGERGLSEAHLETMLQAETSNAGNDVVLEAMLSAMEYERWINNIFLLKYDERLRPTFLDLWDWEGIQVPTSLLLCKPGDRVLLYCPGDGDWKPAHLQDIQADASCVVVNQDGSRLVVEASCIRVGM